MDLYLKVFLSLPISLSPPPSLSLSLSLSPSLEEFVMKMEWFYIWNVLKGGSSIATSMVLEESPDRMLYY